MRVDKRDALELELYHSGGNIVASDDSLRRIVSYLRGGRKLALRTWQGGLRKGTIDITGFDNAFSLFAHRFGGEEWRDGNLIDDLRRLK